MSKTKKAVEESCNKAALKTIRYSRMFKDRKVKFQTFSTTGKKPHYVSKE